jgi:fumarate reductase subunit C
MSLPQISFKEFAKNPIVGLLFLSVIALGFTSYRHQIYLEERIEKLEVELITLKSENLFLRDKIIELIKSNE